MRDHRFSILWRRTAAALAAAGTLWGVSATAGSDSAHSALWALKEAASLQPHFPADRGLSPAAAVILAQVPLLYSYRDAAPWTVPEAEEAPAEDPAAEAPNAPEPPETPETPPDSAPEAPSDPQNVETESTPLAETPVEPPVPSVDNGVRARTLIPTDPSGYTVCGRVYISSTRGDSLSVDALREPFDAELTGDAPQILILHSHGSEAYTPVPGTDVVWSGDCRTTDFRYSVVRAGDEMAAVFAEAGISVLHDRTLYDYPNYTGSYDRSLAAINSYLAQYPSIHFILDVHRDYIADSKGNQYKVVSEIDGIGTAAQMTLVMGSDGSGLEHSRWMENLKLAVAIQEQILTDYPTLMRPILLRKSRYNQHAVTGSLLVEVGAAGNAPEEAFLAARLFAREMTEVLQARSK